MPAVTDMGPAISGEADYWKLLGGVDTAGVHGHSPQRDWIGRKSGMPKLAFSGSGFKNSTFKTRIWLRFEIQHLQEPPAPSNRRSSMAGAIKHGREIVGGPPRRLDRPLP